MKYIEMELLETDLSHAIQKSGGLAPERTARYLRHIVSGLTYMHDIMKMIHRDIKPQNIFVSGRVAKIGDFGCATSLLQEEIGVMGTPSYMPYDIWHFECPMGIRNDVWGCGCVLKLGFIIPHFNCLITFFSSKTQKSNGTAGAHMSIHSTT